MEYVATAVKVNFQLHALDMSVVLAAFDLQLTKHTTNIAAFQNVAIKLFT